MANPVGLRIIEEYCNISCRLLPKQPVGLVAGIKSKEMQHPKSKPNQVFSAITTN